MNLIDYSQYKTFCKCPWAWYERYRECMVPKPPPWQRDDALTVGTLVHNGLENWYKRGVPEIDVGVVEESNPTPDCAVLSQNLVYAYIQRYPSEPWTLIQTEEPVQMPLAAGWNLLAKVDAYFQVDEEIELEDAVNPGQTLHLTPGVWIQEYKTKSQNISRANWMMGWEMNMQASFQALALQYKLGVPVQGAVVNVIEKPRVYIPKRKCKSCGEMYEFASYIPAGEAGYSCPVCGHIQKLNKYEPKVQPTPEFFRILVHRTQEELQRDLKQIMDTAFAMQNMITTGRDAQPPNREACVDARFGPCDYFKNHKYNISVHEDDRMEKKDTSKYMGLEILP
jgi:hypothetical protein